MTQIYVRPRDGLLIRLPDGAGHLPAEGMAVEPSLFWQRRIDDGDVIAAAAEGASGQANPPPKPGKQKEA